MRYIPVLSLNNKPLMPTSPSRARRMIKLNQATPFFSFGQFCIKLKKESKTETQPIVVAIDPGSKREAYTIRSKTDHYLNIQSHAIDWVKDNMQARSEMRRGRRGRNTPCRPPRFNNRAHSKGMRLAPSTKARWQLKLNFVKKLIKIFPISLLKIEDISAKSIKGKNRKNISFGPLQIGKQWFKKEILKLNIQFKQLPGYETYKLRNHFGLSKTKNKMSEGFDAHVVDTAVIAANELGAKNPVQNKEIIFISPSIFSRRQLHKRQPDTYNKRVRVGGIRNKPLHLTKGTIIKLMKPNKTTLKANKHSIFLVGGYDDKNKLTICSIKNQSERINRSVDIKNIKILSYNRYTYR